MHFQLGIFLCTVGLISSLQTESDDSVRLLEWLQSLPLPLEEVTGVLHDIPALSDAHTVVPFFRNFSVHINRVTDITTTLPFYAPGFMLKPENRKLLKVIANANSGLFVAFSKAIRRRLNAIDKRLYANWKSSTRDPVLDRLLINLDTMVGLAAAPLERKIGMWPRLRTPTEEWPAVIQREVFCIRLSILAPIERLFPPVLRIMRDIRFEVPTRLNATKVFFDALRAFREAREDDDDFDPDGAKEPIPRIRHIQEQRGCHLWVV